MVKKGDRVSFKVADVFFPEVDEVLASLTPEVELEGTVMDFSDSGNTPLAFAVVQLHQEQTVVVPVERLRVVALFNSEPKKES